MIRLAIVGDIGSGKSYVAKQFGYPVFNADAEVSKLYRKSRKCYYKLKKILPNYITSFPVEKIKLSKAIIANQQNLKKIIKIVHPEVRNRMNNFIKKHRNKRFVILDIPLLIENKLNKKKDILIFVDAKKKEINKRLKKKPNINTKIQEKFKKLVKKFHPDMNSGNKQYEEKLKIITLAYTQLKNTYKGKIDN